ncbi:MAG: hypothetical protein J3K34DRAFT_522202 [Monoraphidium minutum]|nr:MAG: hypothetical protein J3K34DRAFT_522202 [Monoraphidium minutum]
MAPAAVASALAGAGAGAPAGGDHSGGAGDGGGSCLLDLPDHLLLEVAARADRAALCAASRACRRLAAAAAHPDLWPGFSDDGPVLRAVRAALARALRIPPQAFAVSLDLKRSRRFPVAAPTYSLRPLLRAPDPEALASAISEALQERIARAAPWLWQPGAAPPPASAVIQVCRSDRACVRFGLWPAAAAPAVADELALMGWPPGPVAAGGVTSAAGAAEGGAADGAEGSAGVDDEAASDELLAAVEEAQQQRLPAAAALLRERRVPAFCWLASRRAPTPEEPRERLAAARPPAAAALGGGGAGAGPGAALDPGGSFRECLSVAHRWQQLRRHLSAAATGALAAMAAEAGQEAAAAAALATTASPPDALWRLPGAAASRAGAWADGTSAADMAFCLAGLHDVPGALARACRTRGLQSAHAALQGLCAAWGEHEACAAAEARPALGGVELWGGRGAGACSPTGPSGCGCGDGERGLGFWGQDEGAGEARLLAKGLGGAAGEPAAAAANGGGNTASAALSDPPQAVVAAERRRGRVVVVRHALAVEALRGMTWCLWLLGVL